MRRLVQGAAARGAMLVFGMSFTAGVAGAQGDTLTVARAAPASAVAFTRADLKRLSADTVRWEPHGRPARVYRAVTLAEILRSAGAPLDSMRIGRRGWVILAEARDGYVVAFSAAELEPGLGPTRAWLAYERVDGPLDAGEGPFKLLVPSDGRPPRSAQQIVRLRVVALAPGDSTPPGDLLGDFADDYGNTFSLSPSTFMQRPGNTYHIEEWHPGAQFFVARNDSANASDGGKWTRVDWMMLPGMDPYRWGFCLTAYRARTREAARETAAANRASPRTGCNGFPFSRMRPMPGDG